MTIFDYVRRHAKAFLFTVVVLTISGVAALLRMPVSLFPDVTFPRIVMLADNGEEPSERMMVEVTKPLEEVAGSIPGVNLVRSITNRGSSEISVGLDWSADVQEVLQLLQGRIANTRNSLPSTAEIRVEQMTVSVFPILGYSLTSDSLDLVDLRDIALYQIRPALLRVHGVARVDVVGGDTREFAVTVSPARLAAYHLDIRQVSDAIAKTNLVGAAGRVNDNYQMYLSLVTGQLHSVEDIKAVVIASPGGTPVRVADIAEVAPSTTDRIIRTTARGRDAVLINILKHPTGSTVQIGEDANATVRALSLPRGVRFENFYDQGDFISNSIRGTRDSIAIGIALAMVVLLIFLRNWRMTFVIMLVVPATVATTFLCLSAVGLTVNIMTLGGIAAAVGLIIDDSIVVIDYVFTRLAQRRADKPVTSAAFGEAIAPSLREVFPAILGSTASTIVIHIPLAFLGGITGAFFASLSITMVIALLTSFIFSISFAPLLAADFLRAEDVQREVQREARRSALADWYDNTMHRLLRARVAAIPAALLLLALVYVLYNQIGNSFMPEMDEGTFILDYASPAGTSLDETNRILMNVESVLTSIPEVESYSRRTGTELGFFLTEPNTGDFVVKLRNRRSRSVDEITDEVRKRVEESQPSLRIEFMQLMTDVIGDLTNSPSPVEIKMFGEDKPLLEQKAREVKRIIDAVPGIVDAFDGVVVSGPNVTFRVDPLRAAQAGFSVSELQDELEAVVRGRAETSIQRGEKLMPVRVRYPSLYHTDIQKIESTVLYNSTGAAVPLKNLVAVERNPGQTEIRRERLRQMVAVTARISGRDLGHTVDDIKARLASRFTVPPGVTLEFGGIYQTQQESFRGLLIAAIAAFMLVFFVLLIEFGEFAVPLSIFVVNLLSLLGVFGMLWLSGVSFNISSFVGIIMIIGIVAENAIFVMHAAAQHRAEGVSLDDALIQAGKVRARPILMTTLAAVLALLPLALGIGTGSQMQQPLAIAVIGGFTVSSLLLFFALPLFYRLFRGREE